MKQKISKPKSQDTNSFERKAVETAQSMGKKIIPELYRKAIMENLDDIKILGQWLKELKSHNKKLISLTLTSGEQLDNLTKDDIKNIGWSIRERAKIKSLFYIQEYLEKRIQEMKETGKKITYVDDLTYEETNDFDFLLHNDDAFFNDINTMIRNYSIQEVKNIIDKELNERKMHFVDLLEWYRQLPYALDLDIKIHECEDFILHIRMKSYFKGKKDINSNEEKVINMKLKQIKKFKEQKQALLEDNQTWSKELAIVYRLEQLKNYRRQFEQQGFVMLPSRQKIFDEIFWEVLNGNSTLITGHTGTGKTVLAVKISKSLQEKYFENFIITQELFDEIAKNNEYITFLANSSGKTNDEIKHTLWLDKQSEIDEQHKQSFIKLIKLIQKKFPLELKKKMEEIKNDPQKSKEFDKLTKMLQYNPLFAEVLSGNSWMTVGEISAKLGLEWDGKWWTRTTTQMGKLLKAMEQGKLPIFDEINLVPTDTIMRTKHIFTLKPGEEFSAQEGQWEIIDIKNPTVVATGNFWSKYERNKVDPAVLRLLWGIEATYFDRNETYDIALISLMDKEGFITGVDKWFLEGDQAPLIKLIEALKHIEDNYMGKWSELVIDNKKDNRLKEAILDIGNFVKMFKNYGLDDKQIQLYTKDNIIKFVTNTWYNVEDRKILITIFAQKWLISKKDISAIIARNDSDLTEEILRSCMQGNTDALTTSNLGFPFIYPYELATLDPYQQRNFDKLPATGKTRILAEVIEDIRQEIVNKDDDYYKRDLEQAIDAIYQDTIEKEDAPLDIDLMARIFFDLHKMDMKKLIQRFSKLHQFDVYEKALLKKIADDENMLKKKAELEKKAEEFLKNENYKEAIATLTKMFELDPHDESLVEVLETTKKQYENKIKNLIKKWENEIAKEQYEKANETLNKAWELDKWNKDIEEYLDIIKEKLTEKISSALQEADKLYNKKEFDKAKVKYEEVLKYDNKHQDARAKLLDINQQKFTIKVEKMLSTIENYISDEDFIAAKKEAKHTSDFINNIQQEEEVTYDENKIKNVFKKISQNRRKKVDSIVAQGNLQNAEYEKDKTNKQALENALELWKQANELEEQYLSIK